MNIDEDGNGSLSDGELERVEEEYQEYTKTDPIKKFQFDYDEHVALTREDPTAVFDANKLTKKNYPAATNNFVNVAPGEGQIPVSVLKEKEWDIKTYPHLYPDGKYGMSADRKVKLSHQQYFRQRLFNIDKRFANDAGYLFSALWNIENLQLERNISMAYTHGSKQTTSQGSRTYEVKDSYHVLDNIPDTPEYWKKKKYEILAKLDNFGPFQSFFTLSCADKRWEENFGSLLHEVDVQVHYENDSLTDEIKIYVTVNGETMALEEYLTDRRYCDDSRHTLIRKNVNMATRDFDNRVKEFRKHIVMSKENSMNVKLFKY